MTGRSGAERRTRGSHQPSSRAERKPPPSPPEVWVEPELPRGNFFSSFPPPAREEKEKEEGKPSATAAAGANARGLRSARPAGAAGASPREGRSAPGAPRGARGPRAAGAAAAARVPRAGEGARPAPGPAARRRRRRRRRMYLVAGGRGLAGCGHLSVSLLGLLLLLTRSGTRALVCLPCDESKCEEPRNCPGSIVQGVCGCCYMCARQRNESCGGAYGLHGACDRGLRCVIRPPLNGDSITEYEVGVCEGTAALPRAPSHLARAEQSLPETFPRGERVAGEEGPSLSPGGCPRCLPSGGRGWVSRVSSSQPRIDTHTCSDLVLYLGGPSTPRAGVQRSGDTADAGTREPLGGVRPCRPARIAQCGTQGCTQSTQPASDSGVDLCSSLHSLCDSFYFFLCALPSPPSSSFA